jgi:glycosyltransferase involved in cell wall biosynthesis
MNSTPLVSMVTPFFNTEEFLAECIESVLRQTYQNWEYILVDNHSTDGSSEIAKYYASRFPDRIRLVRTESFLTQVQNYNFTLTQISPSSKYCKFIQADDWLFPDCVRSMVEVGESHPAVGIVGAYELEGDKISLDGVPYATPEISGRDACRLFFLKDLYLFGSPTSLLLRSELIRSRNPFYDERLAPFEDGHLCFDLLKTCDFGFAHQVLTFSRRDNESIIAPMRKFRLEFLLRLRMLTLHGRDYLSEEEYNSCLETRKRDYFLFLCKCALQGRTPEFWEFHRNGLASLNYSLDWSLLRRWMPSAMLQLAAEGVAPNYGATLNPIAPLARLRLAAKVFRDLKKVKWRIDGQIGSTDEALRRTHQSAERATGNADGSLTELNTRAHPIGR